MTNQAIPSWVDYFLKVADICTTYSKASGKIASFLEENPNLLLWTDKDKINLALGITIIKQCYKDAKELQSPKEVENIHSIFLESMKCNDDAMGKFTKGINESNAEMLDEAMAKMGEGTKLIEKAKEMESKFIEKR